MIFTIVSNLSKKLIIAYASYLVVLTALLSGCQQPIPTSSPAPQLTAAIPTAIISPQTPTLSPQPSATLRPTVTPTLKIDLLDVSRNSTFRWTPAPANTIVIDAYLSDGSIYLPFLDNTSLILPAIYGELARLNAEGAYEPYLAEMLPSLQNGLVRFIGNGEDEQLEVEFQLRPGLTWQDGQPLTTDDLVFSWNLVMKPTWPGYHFGNAGLAPEIYVDTVQVLAPDRVAYRFMSQRQAREAAQTGGLLGDHTLYANLVTQTGPVVPLDYLDVGRNVFPKHLLNEMPAGEIANSNFAQRPVYAGAYQLVEAESNGPVTLQAFARFALGKPKIETIIFGSRQGTPTYWEPPEVLAGALKANAIQAQLGVRAVNSRKGENPAIYDALADAQLAEVEWIPRNAWEVLDFNLDNPHLADLRVRQAIAHALNRQALIDGVLAGHGDLMRSYLPTWHPLYAGDALLPDYAYDPALSRRLLQEAGYDISQTPVVHPERGPLTLRFDSMDVNVYPRPPIAELIRQQLAVVGIQIEVKFHEWLEFEAQDCSGIRNSRNFDLAMAAWVGGSDRYPVGWPSQVTASTNIPTPDEDCPYEKSNWSGWRNAEADAILAQLKDGRLALEQPEQYRQLWAEHQRLWASELPSLPLFNSQRPVTVVSALVGVQPSPFAIGNGVEDTWNIFEWLLK